MIDLRVLKDLYTEDGARQIFHEVLTQCVRSIYPSARAIRPNPGDEGIDTFVGEFDSTLRVYQSKYFPDEIGDSQRAQIRDSWKRCREQSYFGRVVLWTLCIPIDMDADESRWWDTWKKKQEKDFGCPIELWCKPSFVSFFAKKELNPIFCCALQRGVTHSSLENALSALRTLALTWPIQSLPSSESFSDALFVRKLEAAGVLQHRSARTAFYNFELLRQSIEQAGDPSEREALQDLLERIFDLWEPLYNERSPGNLGKQLFLDVNKLVDTESGDKLKTSLPAQSIHKKGGLHHWAELCEIGWTENFKALNKKV